MWHITRRTSPDYLMLMLMHAWRMKCKKCREQKSCFRICEGLPAATLISGHESRSRFREARARLHGVQIAKDPRIRKLPYKKNMMKSREQKSFSKGLFNLVNFTYRPRPYSRTAGSVSYVLSWNGPRRLIASPAQGLLRLTDTDTLSLLRASLTVII